MGLEVCFRTSFCTTSRRSIPILRLDRALDSPRCSDFPPPLSCEIARRPRYTSVRHALFLQHHDFDFSEVARVTF